MPRVITLALSLRHSPGTVRHVQADAVYGVDPFVAGTHSQDPHRIKGLKRHLKNLTAFTVLEADLSI